MKRHVRAVRDLMAPDMRLTPRRQHGKRTICVTLAEAQKTYALIEGAAYYAPRQCDDDDIISMMAKLWKVMQDD